MRHPTFFRYGKFFISLFLVLGSSTRAQEIRGRFFERKPSVEAARYCDFSLGDTALLEQKTTYRFFPSGSGSSGEQMESYRSIQLVDERAAAQFARLELKIPPGAQLEEVDFRLWKNGYIWLEGHSENIPPALVDTLYNPVSGEMRAVLLQLPDLQPPMVAEIYYRCSGVPFPHRYHLHENAPLRRAALEVRILSAEPLRYCHSPTLRVEQEREYDFLVYRFESRSSLAAVTKCEKPAVVYLDWQDQVFAYDREQKNNWSGLGKHLFYRGALRDYAVFRNSLAEAMGRQHYATSLHQLPDFYRWHRSDLAYNQARAMGSERLYRAEADRWLAVEQTVKLWAGMAALPVDSALMLLQKRLTREVGEILGHEPWAARSFFQYDLLAKFHIDLLEARGLPWSMVLFRKANPWPTAPDFVSPRPFHAQGMAYYDSVAQSWKHWVIAPYAGLPWGVDEIPPDLAGGQALRFDLAGKDSTWLKLPEADPRQSGWQRHRATQVNFRFHYRRHHDDFRFWGLLQNPLYHQYLLSDSAYDVQSYTPYTALRQALLLKSRGEPKQEKRQFFRGDSLVLSWTGGEAEMLQNPQAVAGQFFWPFPYTVQWHWKLEADAAFEFALSDTAAVHTAVGSWQLHWQKSEDKAMLLEATFVLRKAQFGSAQWEDYARLRARLNRPVKLKLWKKKN